MTLCGRHSRLALRLDNRCAILRTARVLLGAILALLGLPHDALVAGGLEGRLGLNEVPRPLIVKGAGREGAGSEGRQVGQVHVVAS